MYEPFHEKLINLNKDEIQLNDNNMRRLLNHPISERTYFDEYIHLLRSGSCSGVKAFKFRFVIENFLTNKPSPLQKRYLRNLIKSGDKNKKRVVLSFTRSFGRVNQIKIANSINIMLIRDAFSQFYSSLHQYKKHNNFYFIAQYFMILLASEGSFVLEETRNKLGFKRVRIRNLKEYSYWMKISEQKWSKDIALQMEVFCMIYIISHSRALPEVDLAIFIDLLASKQSYRDWISSSIKNISGHEIIFDDCEVPFYREVDLRQVFKAQFLRSFEKLLRFKEIPLNSNALLSSLELLEFSVQ